MVKKCILLFIFYLTGINLIAQEEVSRKNEYPVINWGVKVGLNALTSTHYRVYSGENRLDNTSITNKIGYQGSLFLRINLGNFFMQPEISWDYYRESCSFPAPFNGNPAEIATLDIKNNYAGLNALAGYNIIKDGPYLFNGYIGSSFKYSYLRNYSVMGSEFKDLDKDYNINGIVGFSIHISKLYLDIRYEVSRPNTDIHFEKVEEAPGYLKDITIEKNENILTFSCGMMF